MNNSPLISDRTRNTLICLGLAAVVLSLFWQVRGHDFVSFDDGRYITENPHIQKGLTWESVAWAFSTTYANFWHPVTWLSHMLDWSLYGADPAGHHFTNIMLHAVNAVLLFLVFLRMTQAPWRSALAAVLFAVHPLHVESVAWASERKDVLSTLLWFLTMAAYDRYVAKPSLARYGPVLICFLLGLMAKPMLVSLPFVLLLLDYWPLDRLTRRRTDHGQPNAVGQSVKRQKPGIAVILLEKAPLIFAAAAASALAFHAQETGGATKPLALLPWNIRVMNALSAYGWYVAKTLWPTDLAVFYPHPGRDIAWIPVIVSFLFLLTVTIWALRRFKLSPYMAVGWFWFLGALVPVIGLVQVGDHGMADRYTYVPLIGLFILFSWGAGDLLKGIPRRKTVLAATVSCCVAALSASSWFQIGHWKDSVALFQRALAVGPPSPLTHTDLGEALGMRGKWDQAVAHYEQALVINPNYLAARVNLGSALAARGKLDEAIRHYQEAIRIKPDFAGAHYNCANALAGLGRLDEAVFHYTQALLHQTNDPEIHNNLGIVLARQEKSQEAVAHFQKAIRIAPDFAPAHRNLDMVLRREIIPPVPKK